MYIPPQALYSHNTPLAAAPSNPPVSAALSVRQEPRNLLAERPRKPGQRIAYLYAGDNGDIIGYNTRASVTDYLLRRSLSGAGMFDDMTLAEAFPASGTAHACTSYTANKVASLPLKIMDARREVVQSSPLDQFLQEAPMLLRQIAFSLRIWARVYLRKRYNANRYAPTLDFINPACVTEIPGRDMRVETYQVRDELTGQIENVPVREMIYIQDFDSRPGGAGVSKYEVAWRSLGIEIGIATHTAAFYVNEARPAGVISFSVDPSDEQLDVIVKTIQEQLKGADNAHRSIVIPGGATYTPIQSNARDAMTIDAKAQTVKDICSIFDVNPILINQEAAKDPLGATTTFNAVEVAFVRSVAVTMLKVIVLPQMNMQWAAHDFLDPYTIEVDEKAIPELAESYLSRTDTAAKLADGGLADDAEVRALLGYEPREDYLKRDATKPLALWQGGAVTLDRFGQLVGLLNTDQTFPDLNGNVINAGGAIIPFNRLYEYANLIVEEKKAAVQMAGQSPFGFPMPNQTPTDPALPDGNTISVMPEVVAPLPPQTEERATDTSLCIALSLANNPDLIGMQRGVKKYCESLGITGEWNDPAEFHVTLTYAAQCTDEQAGQVIAALSAIPVPELALGVGSLKSFEGVGQYPVYLRVRQNDALREYQQACYDAMAAAGLELSAYSDPAAYNPHITMGYVNQKPADWTYKGKLTVKPRMMLVWHGDSDVAYEKLCGVPDVQLNKTYEPAPATRTERAPQPVTIALTFSGEDDIPHPFIRQAQRCLDDALRANDQPNPTWTQPADWRLLLMSFPDIKPADAAKLVSAIDVSEQRVLDLWTRGFALDGDTVYLTLEDSSALDALGVALMLEAEDVDLTPTPPGITGIPLCKLSGELDAALLPPSCERLPIVGTAVRLYRGALERKAWALEGESEAQRKEVRAFVKKKRGKNKEQAFTFEALRNHPVSRWLNDAYDAGVDLDDAEAVAFAILAGEDVHYLRAYPDTRAGFVQAVTELFTDAMAGRLTRQKFAAQMRSQLRRFGLLAFRDGMNEVGYDPESFSADELAAFRAWQERSSQFVTGVGEEFFKEREVNKDNARPLTDAGIVQRAEMWANMSLEDARQTGIAASHPETKMTWTWTPSAEHCDDCKFLNGKTYRMDEWLAANLTPASGETACKQGCRCKLVVNPTGKLSALRLIGLSGTRSLPLEIVDEEEPDDGEAEPIKPHNHDENCLQPVDSYTPPDAPVIDANEETTEVATVALTVTDSDGASTTRTVAMNGVPDEAPIPDGATLVLFAEESVDPAQGDTLPVDAVEDESGKQDEPPADAAEGEAA